MNIVIIPRDDALGMRPPIVFSLAPIVDDAKYST